MYLLLRKVAEPYLFAIATSIPSKQFFSKAGNIMTDSKNRLKEGKLQRLLFLNSLCLDYWHLKSTYLVYSILYYVIFKNVNL